MINYNKDVEPIWEALSIPKKECDFISNYFHNVNNKLEETIESFVKEVFAIRDEAKKKTYDGDLEKRLWNLKNHRLGEYANTHAMDMLPDLEAECVLNGITLKDNHYLHIGWCMKAYDELKLLEFKKMDLNIKINM